MKKHRLFVAIAIPLDIQRRLRKETEEWRKLPIRWTREENIHITLLFIGTADDEEMSRIATILPTATEGVESFDIALNHISMGPNIKTPRMVWAEGEAAPALANLQKRITEVVMSDRGYEANHNDDNDDDDSRSLVVGRESSVKPFRLHVTLGRMIPFKWKQVGSDAPRIERPLDISFPVNSIELMESELGPKGPTYTVLSSAELG